MRSSDAWKEEADAWAAWARTPGHDAYWVYRDRFFELVPAPGRATLDLGCGEGRVARDLAERGHSVTGIDASERLVELAREAGGGEFLVAAAEALPFAAASFDLVVAHNSLMDVDDMPQAVREAARVLEPGGRFCVAVTHPMSDAGVFASPDPEAPFVILGSYFGRRRFDETFERDGLRVRFRGWCYPLEAYATALEEAGFLIEALREPLPVVATGRRARRTRIPNFLYLRAVRARTGSP